MINRIYTKILTIFISVFIAINVVNGNILSINNSGQTYQRTFTGKYFCTGYLDIWVNKTSSNYSSTIFYIGYNHNTHTMTGISVGSFFNSMYFMYHTGIDYYFFNATNNEGSTGNSNIALKMSIINKQLTGAILNFYGKSGDTFVEFDPNNSNNTIAIEGDQGNSLRGTSGVAINYEACPCSPDTTKPKIYNPAGYTNGFEVTGKKEMKFLIYDKGGSQVQYWFSGANYSITGVGYTGVGTKNIDNQEGINPETISVKIGYGNNISETFSSGHGLTITPYTGGDFGDMYTWDSHYRGYWISFINTTGYEIEQPITITVSGSDLQIIDTNQCNTSVHSTGLSFTINTVSIPEIKMTSPVSNENNNPDTIIEFTISDVRAGIDSGSISFTILDIKDDNENIIYTGKTYTYDDLSNNIIQSIGEFDGTGGRIGYKVLLKPDTPFPTESQITITGFAKDFVGNSTGGSRTIGIRPDCSKFLGCYNPLNINIFAGNTRQTLLSYTGTLIEVTGTYAPYPYLTGDSGNILDCGPNMTNGLLFTGNIKIYSGGQIYNGNIYTDSKLYITGINFDYTGDDDKNYGIISLQKN